MKRYKLIAIALALLLSLASCNNSINTTPASTNTIASSATVSQESQTEPSATTSIWHHETPSYEITRASNDESEESSGSSTSIDSSDSSTYSNSSATTTRTSERTPRISFNDTTVATLTNEADIEASAIANGLEVWHIDVGNGQTETIYGRFVDTSALDQRVNDYRASLGLPAYIIEHQEVSRLRAVECNYSYSHQRPGGASCDSICGLPTGENLCNSPDINMAYEALYESDGHRGAWESGHEEGTGYGTAYTVGMSSAIFIRYIYEENGEWWGGFGITVQNFYTHWNY